MTDPERYMLDFDALMAEAEHRERRRLDAELTNRINKLRQRGLVVKPRLTLPDMQSIIDSGYGLDEIEQIIWHREHPND
jgi:hypothetical protein